MTDIERAREVARGLSERQKAEWFADDVGQWAFDFGLMQTVQVGQWVVSQLTPLGLLVEVELEKDRADGQ